MLDVDALHVSYGHIAVLRGISLRVGAGELVAVVGPNGVGKTTLFKTISGTVGADSGSIRFEDRELLTTAPARRARLGIAHVPEGRQVFASLSVLDNLRMGAYTPAGRTEFDRNLERIYGFFPVLAERAQQPAGTLSGGEQQMLAIARGLASAPKLLMLDEPSMGLAPAIADEVFERIVSIHREGSLSVLLVEQRVAEALHYAHRGYVLEGGRVILEGDPATLKDSERIREAYLGL